MLRLLFVPLLAVLLVACSDRSDDPGIDSPDVGHDSGDEEERLLELGSADFEASEPASREHIEVAPAARRGVVPSEPPLDITALVSLQNEHIHALLGDDALQTAPLAGQTPGPDYNALRFLPDSDEPSRFGVGVQVWRLPDADARHARRATLQEQFLNTSTAPDAFPDAFLSQRAGLTTLVFDGPGLLLLALSCDQLACDHPAALLPLAESLRAP